MHHLYTLAAAVTILIIGASLIIVLNNYKSERNEIISPELYAPKAKEMSEIKSVAEHNLLIQIPRSKLKLICPKRIFWKRRKIKIP